MLSVSLQFNAPLTPLHGRVDMHHLKVMKARMDAIIQTTDPVKDYIQRYAKEQSRLEIERFSWRIGYHLVRSCKRLWTRRRQFRSELIALKLALINLRFKKKKRLFTSKIGGVQTVYIDLTSSYLKLKQGADLGGIGKVAVKLAEAGLQTHRAVPIAIVDGLAFHYQSGVLNQLVQFKAGDLFIQIDCYWHAFRFYPLFMQKLKREGIFIAVCIHDLIPLYFPELFPFENYITLKSYLRLAMENSDCLISVSRSSAEDIRRYLVDAQFARDDLTICNFSLGFEKEAVDISVIRDAIRGVFSGPCLLSVGSLMPHKGQLIAIEAMNFLWRKGFDCKYVIIASYCQSEVIQKHIEESPYFGTHLFWFRDASDKEVEYAYETASALLQPSLAEGFGLPMIEALYFGLPIIASAIPVFQEIASERARYFRCCDSYELSQAIREFFNQSTLGRRSTFEVTTIVPGWASSLELLIEVLSEEQHRHRS